MHRHAVEEHEKDADEIAHSAPNHVRQPEYELLRRRGDRTEEHLSRGHHQVGDGEIEQENVRRLSQQLPLPKKCHDDERIPREREHKVEREYRSYHRRTVLQIFVDLPKGAVNARRAGVAKEAVKFWFRRVRCIAFVVETSHVEICRVKELRCVENSCHVADILSHTVQCTVTERRI